MPRGTLTLATARRTLDRPPARCDLSATERQGEARMTIQLGQIAPDFEQDSSRGRIRFHDYLAGSWGVLFSHPKDFTPVCTTELAAVARLAPEWAKRNVKVLGLSVDSPENHAGWEKDIEETEGQS